MSKDHGSPIHGERRVYQMIDVRLTQLTRSATEGCARAGGATRQRCKVGDDSGRACAATFLALAHREAPARDDLDAIQVAYRDALDRPLWPITRPAVELLTSPEVARVKECGNHGCGWLFLDTSKNGSRRWCSMESCGSQVKMRRYYARRRAAATA